MQLLTAEEVAEQLGGRITAATVLKARRGGRLAGRKIGRGWHFTRDDVDAWLAATAPAPLLAPVAGLTGPTSRSRARIRRA